MGEEIRVPSNVENELREVKETVIRTEEAVKQMMELQKIELANIKETTAMKFTNLEKQVSQEIELERGKRRGLEARVVILEDERKFNQRALKSELIKYAIVVFFGMVGVAIMKGWL